MPPTIPAALASGSKVAVIAPSGQVNQDRLACGVATLEGWGLQVQVMPHTRESAHGGMFAGSDENRASDFTEAMCSPEFAAVLCARGGHGATRIVDLIDWGRISAATARWLVGSSDVTALHAAVDRRLGWASLHGAMIASEVFGGQTPDFDTIQSLQDGLLKPNGGVVAADEPYVIHDGTAQGKLIGGNLSLICSNVGTTDSVGARGCIVVLEDVDEPPYRIDRMLTQLLRTGWFDGVSGIALGGFHQCGNVRPVLEDRLGLLQVPVIGGFSIGHGPRQLCGPLGVEAALVTRTAALTI